MARRAKDSLQVLPGGEPEVQVVDLGELPPEPQPVWLFWTVMNMLWPAGELAADPPQTAHLPRKRAPRPQ
ncbi:MAG: hypothetical protein HZB16_14590 [Armatimonadetes bacterium]|nr:hypothetical protein [Armatimonadota bacterium]